MAHKLRRDKQEWSSRNMMASDGSDRGDLQPHGIEQNKNDLIH